MRWSFSLICIGQGFGKQPASGAEADAEGVLQNQTDIFFRAVDVVCKCLFLRVIQRWLKLAIVFLHEPDQVLYFRVFGTALVYQAEISVP